MFADMTWQAFSEWFTLLCIELFDPLFCHYAFVVQPHHYHICISKNIITASHNGPKWCKNRKLQKLSPDRVAQITGSGCQDAQIETPRCPDRDARIEMSRSRCPDARIEMPRCPDRDAQIKMPRWRCPNSVF